LKDDNPTDPAAIHQGLVKIRKCRWILWSTLIIYVPGLVVALQLKLSGATMTKLFGFWVILLCVAVGMATVVKCPRCRNTFHTHGPTFLPVRKCVHCGLPVNADKTGKISITSEQPPA